MPDVANNIKSAQNAILGYENLSAAAGLVSRAPIVGTAGLTACIATVTENTKISLIAIKAISSAVGAPTAAQLVGLWVSNGTTARLRAEILVDVVTPSTTVASFERGTIYDDFVLPIGSSLWVSTTITTTAATTALLVVAHGAGM